MRGASLMTALLLGVSLRFARGADAAYAFVPAAAASSSAGALEIPRAASEGDVVLVGHPDIRPAQDSVRPRVIAFGIGETLGEAGHPAPAAGAPPGTLWPDPSGRVSVPRPEAQADSEGDSPNPFLPRGRHRPAPSEAVFACGGVIVGGDAGPLAFMNRRTVRAGDVLGSFRVRSVVREGVVLEVQGSLVMVPVARSARLVLP